MNLLLAILAFNIIVIVHELGHFIAAKKMGIKVLEFSLFVGPKLFSFEKGETTYSLRLFPIMAYVKMEGEEEDSDSERAFCNKPKYARALTAFCGPFANLLLAAVLLTAYFSIDGYSTTRISQIADGAPAAEAGIQEGDKIVSYDGKKVYMPLDMIQFLYVSKGVPAKVEYVRNESGENKLYTTTIRPEKIEAKVRPMLGVTLSDDGSSTISGLSQGYPAEKAGLRAGDRVIRLNDTDIKTSDELIKFIADNGIKPVEVTVQRGDSVVTTEMTPVETKTEESFNVGLAFEYTKGSVLDSLGQSAVFTYSIVRSTAYSLGWLITGKARLNEMMGPIGMVETISTAVKQAPNYMEMLLYLMYITSLLSIAIGATNLIPFPMLDGGRLLLIGVEAVRGKPISRDKEAYISMVGFVLIILLGIYAAYNDIMRIVSG